MDISDARDPVAVVGIGCRFPGGHGATEFWASLRDGRDSIVTVPPDRWSIDGYYDPAPATRGKTDSCWGGFLDGIDDFDAGFFRTSPREAAKIDPQQRILLEVAWEALDDAGLTGEALTGSRTGVFVGVYITDFDALHIADPFHQDLYSIRGASRSVLPGRVSYAMGLQGPSVAIDAACSSSLVAAHMACQSLWLGESDVALAAGANLLLLPSHHIAFSQGGMLSPDGRCKAFDSRANGFVRSEGVGVVVLKRLARAVADGDRVYAVIRGSATNNDGRGGGAAGTPGQAGQEQVLRQAYQDAGVAPDLVHYVEAHGTGTPVGDPVEAGALAAVLGAGRPADRPCMIGSVKTNIGHTEGAAGIAGLIKVALALHHRAVPASLHCQTPTPAIPWDDNRLRVQQELEPWPADDPLLAGVSSFGISGTNVHMVMQGLPETATVEPGVSTSDQMLLPVSAHSPGALRAAAGLMAAYLTGPQAYSLPEVCRTAAVRRSHLDYRCAVTGGSAAQLAARLAAVEADERPTGVAVGRVAADPKPVVFLFSGQGSQWQGMATDLLATEPVFQDAVQQCDRALGTWVDWSVADVLAGRHGDIADAPTDMLQPTLFTIQVALAALWRSWGIEPAAVVGHSVGEVAAAYTAGMLTLDDAVRVVCRRSQLMRAAAGRGGMAVLGLPAGDTADLLSKYDGRLSVAGLNGPTTTLVSGDVDAIEEIIAYATSMDTFCRRVNIDLASHSTHMDEARSELLSELSDLRSTAGSLPFYSTVTAEPVAAGGLDAAYWARNLRDTVLFWPTVERLRRDGYDTFVEISSHPILLGAIAQGSEAELTLLPSMRRDEGPEIGLTSLGQLYAGGAPVAWDHVYPAPGRHVPLPAYPWQRTRFPRKATSEIMYGAGGAGPRAAIGGGHPLLGTRVTPAVHTGSAFWETAIDIRTQTLLADHRVQGIAVFPAAGYAELALAAATELAGAGASYEIAELSLVKTLALPGDGAVHMQVVLTSAEGDHHYQCFSDQREQDAADPDWVLQAHGRLRPTATGATAPSGGVAWHTEEYLRAHSTAEVSAEEHYRRARTIGLDYGPRFQRVAHVWRADAEAWAVLSVPRAVTAARTPFVVDPALLDGCFQTVLAALPEAIDGALYLPVHLGGLRVHGPITDGSVVHARLTGPPDGGTQPGADRSPAQSLEASIVVVDGAGTTVLEVDRIRLRRIDADAAQIGPRTNLRYRVVWRPVDAPPAVTPATAARYLVIEPDGGALHDALRDDGHSCVHVRASAEFKRHDADHYELDVESPADFPRLLRAMADDGRGAPTGVVYAPSPAMGDLGDDPSDALRRVCGGALHLVQALATAPGPAPRLWLVTTGAQPVLAGDEPDVVHATLCGLGRTVAHEYPDFRCTIVDLESGGTGAAEVRAELAAGDEDEVAWRGGVRHAARLVPAIDSVTSSAPSPLAVAHRRVAPPYRLAMTAPGSFDRLQPMPMARPEPATGHVEISVDVAALNFKDIMHAMGLIPLAGGGPIPLGIECAGHVARIGPGVSGLTVGQPVVTITDSAGGCLSSYVLADARVVVPVPDGLDLDAAVTVPIAFLTAYYGLCHVGRMAKGDRVLVHAASGGVGLAAVQLVRAAGAEVFATAGNETKRAYLRDELGIEHVLDSRSTLFGQQVRDLTGGRGVDIVLNSLTGDAIAAGLGALAPHGRFIELGKRDMLENSHVSLLPFRRALSFSAVDVEALLRDEPALLGELLRDLMARLGRGELQPLPARSFPVEQADEALRYLAQAKHIGKVLVTMAAPQATAGRLPIRPDGSYLITGGLGALGLCTARLLVDEGARHVVLMARHAPTAETAATVAELRSRGSTVTIAQADVGDPAQLAPVMRRFGQDLPALRGIVHTAGVLADRTVARLNWADVESVLRPKVNGAWHLDRLSPGTDLDFFVLFSSVTAVIGSPGQANYGAANCGMDALAHHRRRRGLAAQAINWGPWSDIGLAARPDRGGRLADRGLDSMDPAEGIEALAHEMAGGEAQVVVTPFDAHEWARSAPRAARSSLLRDLLADGAGVRAPAVEEGLDRATLLESTPDVRRKMMIAYLSYQVARIARADLGSVRPDDRVTSLGVDSLMAMELKHVLDADVGTSMPTVRLLRGPSIEDLADYLLAALFEPGPAVTPAPGGDGTAEDRLLDQLAGLSDDDVGAVLGHLLSEEDGE